MFPYNLNLVAQKYTILLYLMQNINRTNLT